MRKRHLCLVFAMLMLMVAVATSGVFPRYQPAYAGASLSPKVFLPLTISHPPDPTPSPGFQPSYPIRAGFFYPWYPQAWTQSRIFPFTNYHPTLGNYSSIDDALIDTQLKLIAKAHLSAMISSWWGQGQHSDTSFAHILGRSERAGSPYQALNSHGTNSRLHITIATKRGANFRSNQPIGRTSRTQ